MKTYILLALLTISSVSHSQTLNLKADEVKVEFIADMQKTAGTIGGFEANIIFNPEDLSKSSVEGSVDVSTLSTGNNGRDKHLKSDDYFDVESYPKMTFKSTSLISEGEKYVMKGDLTIKESTHPAIIEFTYIDNVFVGSTTINTTNYSLGSFSKGKPSKKNVTINFSIPVE